MADIDYRLDDGIAIATYNRPEVLNALRRRTYTELRTIVETFAGDDRCRVLILAGSGRAFCAGQDLTELPSENDVDLQSLDEQLQLTQDITRLLLSSNKPSIAAINGPAIGAGIEIPLACSLRVAADDSYFQFAEINRGLFQTNGAIYLLPRIIGLGRATHALLTGERIEAKAALEAGLVTRLVPPAELMATAKAYATRLADAGGKSTSLVLQGLRKAYELGLEEILDYEVNGNLSLIDNNRRTGGLD